MASPISGDRYVKRFNYSADEARDLIQNWVDVNDGNDIFSSSDDSDDENLPTCDENEAKESDDESVDSESETHDRAPVNNISTGGKPIEYKWTDVTKNDEYGSRGIRFRPENEPGPRNIDERSDLLDDDAEPVEFFKLLMSENIVDKLVTEINRYATEKITDDIENLKPRSRLRDWKPTCSSEIYLFFAVIINMGIIRLPSVQSYWLTDWVSAIPFFSSTMKRDRFLLLYHTMLHICQTDPENRERGDKIQPLVDDLVTNFQYYFVPYQNIAADESMIGYKGRVIFRQYIPKKPIKWGILARTLADSVTGYMCNINIYYGKTANEPINKDTLTKTSRSIFTLCNQL